MNEARSGPASGLRDVDSRRIAACFRAAGSSAALVDLLRAEPRFEARLLQLLAARHAPVLAGADGTAPPIEAADEPAARLDRPALEALAFRSGMVLQANAFAREIRQAKVAAMMDRFGESAFRNALANRDLAGDEAASGDLDALEAVVRQGGEACLADWLAQLSPALAARVRLKWPDDAAVPSARGRVPPGRGAAILRRLAAATDDAGR